jgi:hypothetical protein
MNDAAEIKQRQRIMNRVKLNWNTLAEPVPSPFLGLLI